jgi:hypothetical protein
MQIVLKEAKKVFFLGYSFPDTDKYIVGLMKKSWKRNRPQKIIVVNPGDVKARYEQAFNEIFGRPMDKAIWNTGTDKGKFKIFLYEDLQNHLG